MQLDRLCASRVQHVPSQHPYASRSVQASTLNVTGPSRVTLSPQQEHLRAVRGPWQEERSLTFARNDPCRHRLLSTYFSVWAYYVLTQDVENVLKNTMQSADAPDMRDVFALCSLRNRPRR